MDSIYSYIMECLKNGQELDEVVRNVTSSINNAKTDYENQKQKNKTRQIALMRHVATDLGALLETFDVDKELVRQVTNMSDEEIAEVLETLEVEIKRFKNLANNLDTLKRDFFSMMNNNQEHEKINKDYYKNEKTNEVKGTSSIPFFPNIEEFLKNLQ